MLYTILKSKIHQATITQSSLHYEGSITIDQNLMKKVQLITYEKVLVTNITRGTRLETYVITGKPGSKTIGLNGAAARLGKIGDRVTIMSFTQKNQKEATKNKPKIIVLDKNNHIKKSSV